MTWTHVAIDCETGGFEPNESCLLTAFFLLLDDDMNPGPYLSLYVKSIKDMVSQSALDVNKINLAEHNKMAMTRDDAGAAVFKFFAPYQKLIPIGHNHPFDRKFIDYYLHEGNWTRKLHYQDQDTQKIANYLIKCGISKSSSPSLEKMCKEFKISYSAHNAETDTLACVELFRRELLLGRGVRIEDLPPIKIEPISQVHA